jgi:hypothetical protein
LYVLNFDNSRFQATGHSSHTQSNQAAIHKQGVAVRAVIQAVLAVENCKSVILVGHSMGGLAIREYLQRGFDGTANGRGTNWVDQTSPSGHHVIRVVTTGTPHLGSNHTGALLSALAGIDERSEACRDLRYPRSSGFPIPVTVPAPFLFGGQENLFQWTPAPYNLDVNCNGAAGDQVVGLSSGTTFNSSMPLPANIKYTWITSNLSGSGQDGLVETPRQWLYNGSVATPATADTLLLAISHLDEPNDAASIIRGMDEPGDTALAFDLSPGPPIKGFMTPGMNWNTPDKDVYRLTLSADGVLDISITGSTSGIDSLVVFTATAELARTSVGDGTKSAVVKNVKRGQTCYVSVRGTATGSTYLHPYALSASLLATAVNYAETVLPDQFELHQNYPNPFNPSTAISYQLTSAAFVTIKVFDALGQEVATLENEERQSGVHTVRWDGSRSPSGVYFYQLTAGGLRASKTMVLLK